MAYHVLGDGPIDLLAFNSGTNIWIDRDDEPHWSRFDRRLASFSRLIRFDPSGVGLSDPLVGEGSGPTIELWVQDALAVLDAVGSSQAALLGVSAGGLVAMLFAATCPERTSAQVLIHCWARMARDSDSPWGWPKDVLDRWVDTVPNPTSRGDAFDDLALSAPSLTGDVEFRSWWTRAGERSSPAIARAMDVLTMGSDIRAVLPLINTPTLVLHRIDNPMVPIGHGRYLAANIPGAELIELPGQDHIPFAGDTDALLDDIEEFLTGTRGTPNTDRTLATILFTDIVDSTKRAAGTGDRRWRELLDNHDRMTARQVRRFGGRPIKTTGDGILATFDGPARAIQSGLAICHGARQLGLEVRVGVHTGEVERRGDDVAGIGVHIAARVQAHAQAGEVWVSRTVTDLVTGSGITFHERGEHTLKGVPGAWQLFTVVS